MICLFRVAVAGRRLPVNHMDGVRNGGGFTSGVVWAWRARPEWSTPSGLCQVRPNVEHPVANIRGRIMIAGCARE
jgi:hypothetical protein